mgnify:CR=1 FL=1
MVGVEVGELPEDLEGGGEVVGVDAGVVVADNLLRPGADDEGVELEDGMTSPARVRRLGAARRAHRRPRSTPRRPA